MDIADLADQVIEEHLLISLHRLERDRRPTQKLTEQCQGCGVTIPVARLQAVPGCTHCVSCAEQNERRAAGYSSLGLRKCATESLDDYLLNIT